MTFSVRPTPLNAVRAWIDPGCHVRNPNRKTGKINLQERRAVHVDLEDFFGTDQLNNVRIFECYEVFSRAYADRFDTDKKENRMK